MIMDRLIIGTPFSTKRDLRRLGFLLQKASHRGSSDSRTAGQPDGRGVWGLELVIRVETLDLQLESFKKL